MWLDFLPSGKAIRDFRNERLLECVLRVKLLLI